jgi:hypothetical protein
MARIPEAKVHRDEFMVSPQGEERKRRPPCSPVSGIDGV